MGGPDPAPLAEIMNRLWVRHLPEIEQRVAVLESAASAHAEGRLTAELCEHAHAASHKLAGVLGTFGLAEGTGAPGSAKLIFSMPMAGVSPCFQRTRLRRSPPGSGSSSKVGALDCGSLTGLAGPIFRASFPRFSRLASVTDKATAPIRKIAWSSYTRP